MEKVKNTKIRNIMSGIIAFAIAGTIVSFSGSETAYNDKIVYAENPETSESEEMSLEIGKVTVWDPGTVTVDVVIDVPEGFQYDTILLSIKYDTRLKFKGLESGSMDGKSLSCDYSDEKGMLYIVTSKGSNLTVKSGTILGLQFEVPESDYSNTYEVKWRDPSEYHYCFFSSSLNQEQCKTNFTDGCIYMSTIGILKGDVNGDHYADTTDLSILALYLIDGEGIPDSRLKEADTNSDGKATLADLAHFRQYLSKVIKNI